MRKARLTHCQKRQAIDFKLFCPKRDQLCAGRKGGAAQFQRPQGMAMKIFLIGGACVVGENDMEIEFKSGPGRGLDAAFGRQAGQYQSVDAGGAQPVCQARVRQRR